MDTKFHNNDKSRPTALSRGTIIVDTSSLFKLMVQIPPGSLENPTDQPRSLLEILPFLADEGFKVIIPAMVALEAEDFLSDGKILGQYFGRTPSNDDVLFKFFTKNRKSKKIQLAHPRENDLTECARYVRAVYEIHKGNQPAWKKAELIQELNGKTSKSHFGDYAAIELIKNAPNSGPIFYLCDDLPALDAALLSRQDKNVHALTTRTLLEVFDKRNLFSGLGFSKYLTCFKCADFIARLPRKKSSRDAENIFLNRHNSADQWKMFIQTLSGIDAKQRNAAQRELTADRRDYASPQPAASSGLFNALNFGDLSNLSLG